MLRGLREFNQQRRARAQAEDQQSSFECGVEWREVQSDDHQQRREDEVRQQHLDDERPVFQVPRDFRGTLRQANIQHRGDYEYRSDDLNGAPQEIEHFFLPVNLTKKQTSPAVQIAAEINNVDVRG